MSTLIEDPEIPLVGMNGGFPLYASTSDISSKINRSTLSNVGVRLAKRKKLFYKRRRLADVSLCLALFGIFITVLETEMRLGHVYNRSDVPSLVMRGTVSFTTLCLLLVLGFYHWFDIKIFTMDNSIDDWTLCLTRQRVFKMIFEFVVCVIHPFPQQFELTWVTTSDDWSKTHASNQVPLDIVLTLPMFLRLYLVWRVVMLHSKLFTDASSQSLGALNQIPFNFGFVFKSIMAMHADYVLTAVMVLMFLVASWLFRACEIYVSETQLHGNLLDAMWLVAITFLSVGYGDIFPHSYCGRTICVVTGIMGAACTALVVAVFARKLELSRSERYVHDFVIDVDLEKKRKHAAANILKAGWLVYKFKRIGSHAYHVRKYQRKLLKSIHTIREIKAAQRRLIDGAVTIIEMNKGQARLSRDVILIRERQTNMDKKVAGLEKSLISIDNRLDYICDMLAKQKAGEK